ncbi:MAG: outer membrane beta-barrel protein [Bacteroidales bacterium]|nr:outer membrane beta-barrel protein [Bacteroidales bacterium]
MRKAFITSLLTIVVTLGLSASDLKGYPRKSLFVNLSADYSRLYNKTIYNDSPWNAQGGLGYSFEAGYLMRLRKSVSLGFGAGLSSYYSEIKMDSYQTTYPTLDVDGDSYTEFIQANGLVESTRITTLDIPVFLELGNANTSKVSYYVRLGVKISTPVAYNFTHSGSMSVSGNYAQYFVRLEGIPELGFVDNAPVIKSSEYDLNPVNLSVLLAGGITIPVSDYIIFKLGADLNYGLMNISSYEQEVSKDPGFINIYNNLLTEPNSKTIWQSVGFEFGIIYILKSIY